MKSPLFPPLSIDIFCAVVDNFGDIGVCWRLARQLAVERGLKTRLFVDDMAAFRAIVPFPDRAVEVAEWTPALSYPVAADIVIEAFACTLPEQVVSAMVHKKNVIWIDLEYLTAEDWAIGCHAIPSRHPQTGLNKTLFFPGFDGRTGGVLHENDLILRRNAFFNDKKAQNQWRKAHFLPEIDENSLDISVFCYETAPISHFLDGIAVGGRVVRVFRPGRDADLRVTRNGTLEIYDIPFLSQYEYDYLLWTTSINFVRGEDSFVRAQLSGKPFIWNIYVQDSSAHLVKLAAFLDKVQPFYDPACFERLAKFHKVWNEEGHIEPRIVQDAWLDALTSLDNWGAGARKWADYLTNQPDLASRLLDFAAIELAKTRGSKA